MSQAQVVTKVQDDFLALVPQYNPFKNGLQTKARKGRKKKDRIYDLEDPKFDFDESEFEETDEDSDSFEIDDDDQAVRKKRDDRFYFRYADKLAPLEPAQVQRIFLLRDKLRARIAAGDSSPILRLRIQYLHDLLLKHNQRIITKIALQYQNRGVKIEDLIQEANIGFMRAVEKFDVTLGWTISTYAAWWIREGVSRCVMNQRRTIRVPIQQQQKRIKVQKAFGYGFTELQESLTAKQLAAMTGFSEREIEEFKTFDFDPKSLDHETPEGKRFGDTIPDEDSLPPHQAAAVTQDWHLLYEAIDQLGPDNARFIRRKFGLGGNHARTDAQMADLYCQSEAEIRKRTSQLLNQLREHIDLDMFNSRDFLDQ